MRETIPVVCSVLGRIVGCLGFAIAGLIIGTRLMKWYFAVGPDKMSQGIIGSIGFIVMGIPLAIVGVFVGGPLGAWLGASVWKLLSSRA